MLRLFKNNIKRVRDFIAPGPKQDPSEKRIEKYLANGRVAWTEGYNEYKYQEIKKALSEKNLVNSVKNRVLPANFGFRLDDRITEYVWIFSKLSNESTMMLDAGSTFNFEYLLDHPAISKKYLFIHTYNPEKANFSRKRISYIYGDLRNLPYKDGLFDEIVSQSTIEHIDMDNTIYGYDIKHSLGERSYEYLKAVAELVRVLKSQGQLLLTFPFGKYEHHGFFQQFDDEMLERIVSILRTIGQTSLDFFKYEENGWRFASKSELENVVSYNPHTGQGKLGDGAAHCRGIACICFVKN